MIPLDINIQPILLRNLYSIFWRVHNLNAFIDCQFIHDVTPALRKSNKQKYNIHYISV